MANVSNFTDVFPSATSKVSEGDDELRSIKSFMRNWWEQEHYAVDSYAAASAASAGVHRAGSARAFTQAAEPAAPVAPDGQLWVDTDDLSFHVYSNTSFGKITDQFAFASAQTFTALQEFTSGISASQITVSAKVNALSDITTNTDVFVTKTLSAGSVKLNTGGAHFNALYSGTTTWDHGSVGTWGGLASSLWSGPAGIVHGDMTIVSQGDDTPTNPLTYVLKVWPGESLSLSVFNPDVGAAYDPGSSTFTYLIFGIR